MKPRKFVGTYFITLALYLVLDFVWLDIIAKSFYQTHLDKFIGRFYWPAALIFYLIYTLGITYLIILPNLRNNVFFTAFKGGFLGLLAYCAYDLTNLATINNWPLIVVITDIMWGFLLSLITTLIATSLVQKSQKK